MTIRELRNAFTKDTKFYFCETIKKFEINNYLFGTNAFASMEISYIEVENDVVNVYITDMPYIVFLAWERDAYGFSLKGE